MGNYKKACAEVLAMQERCHEVNSSRQKLAKELSESQSQGVKLAARLQGAEQQVG